MNNSNLHDANLESAFSTFGFNQRDKEFIKIGCAYIDANPSIKRIKDTRLHFHFNKKVSAYLGIIEAIYARTPVIAGSSVSMQIVNKSVELLLIKKAKEKTQNARILNNNNQPQR